VQELNGSVPPSPTAELLTGFNIDEYFTRTDTSGTMDFLTDTLGSTIALTNSGGSINTSYTYGPFGSVTSSGQTNLIVSITRPVRSGRPWKAEGENAQAPTSEARREGW
jgi:hypothetical protein